MDEHFDLSVNGTLVWYYFICPREVWLMARRIAPDQDDENIDLGNFMHQFYYRREKKEFDIGYIKFDVIKEKDGQLVIGEVKKTSKYEKSAKMQLAFYLYELKKAGISAKGELMFPKEKKKIPVDLDESLEKELQKMIKDILRIAYMETPPPPKKITFCRNCAYSEFCWS